MCPMWEFRFRFPKCFNPQRLQQHEGAEIFTMCNAAIVKKNVKYVQRVAAYVWYL